MFVSMTTQPFWSLTAIDRSLMHITVNTFLFSVTVGPVQHAALGHVAEGASRFSNS